MKAISIENLIQSPFLHLQAAGSDFSDYSSRGVHLRWQLKGRLGDEHFPKGDLAANGGPYPTTIGFNKADDYVYLYKSNYKAEYPVDVVLIKPPTSVVETGPQRKWIYTQLPVNGLQGVTTDVEVRFMDVNLYNQIRAQFSPMSHPADFIKLYTGVLEVQPVNQLMYKSCFLVQALKDNCELAVETISVPDLASVSQRYISCREKLPMGTKIDPNNREGACFTCENMEYARFRCTDGYVKVIRVYTYDNLFRGYQNNWQLVKKFSLTEDLKEIIVRLDDPQGPENKVNGNWPKFNDVNIGTGAFTVSIPNYLDRWNPALNPSDGISQAVKNYLQLSRTDLLAQSSAPSSDPDNMTVNEFSYLQTLNILASDYHVARMLGLGHIDQQQKEEVNVPYIYCAVYITNATLGPGLPAKARRHISISLPTTQKDYRYPPVPRLKPVSYGLIPSSGTQSLTNANGYTPDGLVRFVNVNMHSFPHQRPFESFFANPEPFCTCAQTIPVLYGLEYKHDSEPNYRQPELLHDSFYFDRSGLPETLPIPDQNNPGQPVYTHRETEEGIHHYALYSINWFSRVSPVSNNVITDTTVFNRKPLPPINLMTQFIQQENQLIFTTAAEQTLLSGIAGADKSLARVTFEWNQTHQDAYQFADEVELFIRRQQPLMVRGKVTNVQNLSNNRALVSTGPMVFSSTTPPTTVQPVIAPALAASFAGGVLAVGQLLFEIESVTASVSGNNPSFTVKKILQRTSVEDPNDPGSYLMSEVYTAPSVNEFFSANQNLSQPAQWDAMLDKKVKLEKFFQLELILSSHAANNRYYTVLNVAKAGANTEITVKNPVANPGAATPGKIRYKKYIKYFQVIHSQKAILLNESLAGEIAAGDAIQLYAAGGNSGNKTVSAVFFGNHFTRIEVVQALPDNSAQAGVLIIEKTKTITALTANKFIIGGQNLVKELIPAYREFYLIDQGENVHEFVIGGIDDTAQIASIPDPLTGDPSGAFAVTLNNFVLQPHQDTDVSWYKGSIRIEEDPANFPPPASPNYRRPDIKVLQIVSMNLSGPQTQLVVYDPTFVSGSAMSNPLEDYMPVRTGAAVKVNVHPGYKVYLNKANANAAGTNPFKSSDLLPAVGEGTRQTLLSVRAKDSSNGKVSGITAPVVLLAQEVIIPEPPGIPTGPTFATRPDVYGKSTYTFDMNVNTSGGRQPYAIVCYRADIRKALSALYKPATVEDILNDLKDLETTNPSDAAFFNDRFNDLVNVDYDTATNQFKAYVSGGYRFPVPDNDAYVIPNSDTSIVQKPFNGTRFFGQNFTVTLYKNGNGTPVTESQTMLRIIKDALDGAFLPLTEQPMLYRYLKSGRLTSPAEPKVRNSNGEIIVPGNPINFNEFDPFPMAVKYVDGVQTKVRFTDYKLDGAAKAWYFYYAVEMNNKFEVSDRSPVTGPISLVNTIPAEPPAIKEVISTPANLLTSTGPFVTFKINNFIESESIKRIRIYRSTNHYDAVTVRNMSLAAELAITDTLKDTFADVTDVPYAEPLYYRVVALREITNEQGLTEYVPSKPSEIALTNVIDTVNPEAPALSYTSDPYLPADANMNNVVLSWNKTVHNGKYTLFKLTTTGNWQKIHEVVSNAAVLQVPLASTLLGSGTLQKLDTDGNTIYSQFKVQVSNSSNLLSRTDKVLAI